MAIFALVLPWTGWAQTAVQPSLTKEQKLNMLKLEDRRLLLEQRRKSLETYRKERDTTRELFDQGFIALQRFKQTLNKYEQAKLDYAKAEILLEQTKLDLLENATHIIVVEARKYKTEDGKSMVDLVLENASDTRDALLVDPSLSSL
jgi:multidrug resistance efflux pump